MNLRITRWWGLAVSASALGSIVVLAACSDDAEPAEDRAAGEAQAPPVAPEPEQEADPEVEPEPVPETARVIAEQLEAGLAADPTSVLSSEAAFTLDQAREGLPAGSEVKVHEDSWTPVGAGGSGVVVVTAKQPSGLEGTFAAVVQLEGSEWKILSTFALEEAP